MKILQVGSALAGWAGIEKYVVHLSGGLSAKRNEVWVTVQPGSPLAGALVGAPSGLIELSVRHKFDLSALAAYLRLFRSQRFDVVHTHFNPDFLLVAYAARMSRIPRLVMTRHVALPWAKLKARNYSRLYDRIVPVSEAARRKLLASGVAADRMRMAKAGCPALTSTSPQALEGRFKIGFFGRLAREKGIEVLLASARTMDPAGGIVFHVFGEGPLKSELEAAAPPIKFHGFRPDIADCMAAVDVVVIPSIWEEAFPYSALEAMSLGRAIVASDIGGLPELIQPNVNGLLFKPGDSADLVRALTQLSNDRQLTQLLGSRGREIQREEYTVERMAERMIAVYEEIEPGQRLAVPSKIQNPKSKIQN